MPTPFNVICADRDTGADYEVQIMADSPQAALQRAAAAGHVVGGIAPPPPPPPPPPAPDHSLAILYELQSMRPLLQDCAAFSRRQKHITVSIITGVMLGLFLFSLLSALLAAIFIEQSRYWHLQHPAP